MPAVKKEISYLLSASDDREYSRGIPGPMDVEERTDRFGCPPTLVALEGDNTFVALCAKRTISIIRHYQLYERTTHVWL